MFRFEVDPSCLGRECRLFERSVEVDSKCRTVQNGCMIMQYGALSGIAYVFGECRSPSIKPVARATVLSEVSWSDFKRFKAGYVLLLNLHF
jgi:hypothetical protein